MLTGDRDPENGFRSRPRHANVGKGSNSATRIQNGIETPRRQVQEGDSVGGTTANRTRHGRHSQGSFLASERAPTLPSVASIPRDMGGSSPPPVKINVLLRLRHVGNRSGEGDVF